nr:hypothetical protein [Mycobacterium szulgai]
MARYGPPDDFHNQETQHAPFGMGGYPPPGPPPPADQFEPYEPETEPQPWYRKPATLIGWALLVAILIALIIYGIVALMNEDRGPTRSPATTTAPSTTTTTPSTTTTTPPPSPSETTTEPPSTEVPPNTTPPVQQPPRPPTQAPPTHRHLPPLPSVITIPGVPTPITLPPHLP